MNEMLLEQNAQYRQNRTSQANLGISGQQMQQQVPVGVPTVAVAQVIFEHSMGEHFKSLQLHHSN